MLDEYLLCLYKQYCEAKGIEPLPVKVYPTQFLDWISENNYLLEDYMEYLHCLGFDYAKENTIEVGKGIFDSLKDHEIRLVSPFAETIGENNSRLMVVRGTPLILAKNEISIPNELTILTHNPYRISSIDGWNNVHNRGLKNISIGMFGRLNDENRKEKIGLLEDLAKTMTDDYSFNYDTNNGNYFVTLNSNRKKLKKVRIR